jgi:hypothetical protein
MIEYSLGLVVGYASAKAMTPYVPSLLTKKYHIHHWVWAIALLVVALYLGVSNDAFIGIITGIALEGLSYKNWSVKRRLHNDAR